MGVSQDLPADPFSHNPSIDSPTLSRSDPTTASTIASTSARKVSGLGYRSVQPSEMAGSLTPLRGTVVHHPLDAELVLERAVVITPSLVGDVHLDIAALRQPIENLVGLFLAIRVN